MSPREQKVFRQPDWMIRYLTFCTTSGVPKSLPPCRRKPQGEPSNLDSLTLISCAISLWLLWTLFGCIGANERMITGNGFENYGRPMRRSFDAVSRYCDTRYTIDVGSPISVLTPAVYVYIAKEVYCTVTQVERGGHVRSRRTRRPE